MKNTTKLLALTLALITLLTSLPLAVLAVDESVQPTETATINGEPYYGDYWYYYNFDNEAVGKAIHNFTSISDPAGNPYGFKNQGTMNATIQQHEDGSGNYLAVRYKASYGWRGAQLGVVDETTLTDYSMVNGLEISFKIRWVGTGALADGDGMNLVNIRRSTATGHTNTTILSANYEASSGDLVLKTSKGTVVARLKKGASEFTEVKVDWHEATSTYSVFIDGVAKAEGIDMPYEFRTSDFMTTTYDDDLVATRKAFEKAYDRMTLQIGRVDFTDDTSKQFHYDLDDLIIKEGTLYQNTFETIGEKTNSFKADATAQNTFFYRNKNVATIATEKVNGVSNTYLSFPAGARLDFKDYTYQFLQDGNWTVDFKVRASAGSKTNFFRLYDRISTNQMLYVDKEGSIYLGNHKFPGVSMAAADGSEGWTRITLSVLLDDNNLGVYDEYPVGTNVLATNRYPRYYRVAVWVDGVYAGSGTFNRDEVGVDSTTQGKTIIDKTNTTVTSISEDDFNALTGLTLADNSNGIETYKTSDGTLYQLKRNEDGTFASCTKIVFSGKKNEDVLGFFNKDSSTLTGAIDDISIYRGVGPREYATSKTDAEGTVSALDFARMSTTATHVMAEGVYDKILGSMYVRGYRTKSGDDYTRVAATGSEKAYVKIANTGSGRSALYLNASNTGGKSFAVNLTLRNVKATDADMRFLNLTRQNEAGKDKALISQAIYVEKSTSYLYFLADGVKYYLCAMGGKRYNFGESDWKKLTVIYDETGSETLVSFLVNDELAYYCKATTTGIDIPFAAVGISGVVSDEFFAMRNAVDQRAELYFNSDKKFSFDALSASVEYAQAPETPKYEKTAAIDFSEFESIDEFKAKYGHQFIMVDGSGDNKITIEDGVLKVPSGARFGWIDYYGTFVDYFKTYSADPTYKYRFNDGYAIEAKIKASDERNGQQGLIKLNFDEEKNKSFVYMNSGKIYMSGALSGYTLNTLSSGKFTELSVLFTNFAKFDNKSAVFADGKMLGVVGFANGFAYNNVVDDRVAITFADKVEISELYIHRDQKRTLAAKSGNIFELTPDAFLPARIWDDKCYPVVLYGASGVLDSDTNAIKSYAKLLNDPQVGNYWSFNFVETEEEIEAAGYGNILTSQTWNDIVVTDYLEDETTVIEYDFRFTPHKNADDNVSIELVNIRRTEDGSTSNTMDYLLSIAETGRIICGDGSNRYTLCYENGDTVYLDGKTWTNIAVIYDADAGKVSYVVNGTIYNYKDSDGNVIGLAHNIQLSSQRHYRMDAADTKIRFLNTPKTGAIGKLDFAGIKIYNTDVTANVGYVGAQPDTKENNIRLVAGADMLYYGNVGFEVELFDENGKSLYGKKEIHSTNTVYSSIVENANGVESVIYPEDYGYRYFYTANLYGVETEGAVRLNVTPFSTVNGVRYDASSVILDLNFNKDLSLDERSISTSSIEVKPQGTNTSADANFSATDIVQYTNDGALEFNGLGAKFAFAADFAGGDATVNLTNAKGEVSEKSVLNVYVDGVLTQENLNLEFGHHTLVLAKELVGEHEIVIEKVSGGDFICINSFSVCGELMTPPELATEGAVNVVVNTPESGKEYGNVDVYVRTTEKSGNYYIRYNFDYVKVGVGSYTYLTGTSNTHYNTDVYRIVTANLVEKKADGSYAAMFDVLQNGEVSLAIRENHLCTVAEFAAANELMGVKKYAETKDEQISAPDFVGGFHGDEVMLEDGVKFYLDGVEIDPTTPGTYTGTHFEFVQDSIINRCDEVDEKVMSHGQYILLDTNGLRLEQRVEFLTDDFYPKSGETYLQMATAYRINTGLKKEEAGKVTFTYTKDKKTHEKEVTLYNLAQVENLIIHTTNTLDANGDVIGTGDMGDIKYLYTGEIGYHTVSCGGGTTDTNRYAEYIGDKGVYGRVGFIVDDYSAKANAAQVQVRTQQGDNKWYASFYTYNAVKGAVPLGEVWNVSDYYYFDYNPEVHSVAYEKAE